MLIRRILLKFKRKGAARFILTPKSSCFGTKTAGEIRQRQKLTWVGAGGTLADASVFSSGTSLHVSPPGSHVDGERDSLSSWNLPSPPSPLSTEVSLSIL